MKTPYGNSAIVILENGHSFQCMLRIVRDEDSLVLITEDGTELVQDHYIKLDCVWLIDADDTLLELVKGILGPRGVKVFNAALDDSSYMRVNGFQRGWRGEV